MAPSRSALRPETASDPAAAFEELARRPFPFLLETQAGTGSTILGSDPFLVLTAKGGQVTEWREGRSRTWRADPFEVLRETLARYARPGEGSTFNGGAVGYLGYDLAGHIEKLPRQAVDDRNFPDLFLAFHDRFTIVDPAGRSREVDLGLGLPRAIHPDSCRKAFPSTAGAVAANFSRDAYLAAIRRVKEHIAAGDVYQVNLSQRFAARTTVPPIEIYRRLRAASPAPCGAILELGGQAIVSSSPELFLRREGSRVVTRPIKGTRKRGATPDDDARLRAELMASPKDDAELTMIVDLERNDLGRVCDYGSVRVAAAKELESHPTVHHLVATIEGRLRDGRDSVDLLRATFPSGSVTGAPKIRAMEIIDALEPTRRAAYTGALGWIGFDGALSLAIAIRTVEIDGSTAWFQAGGGIVADSDPEAEYDETLVKAAAMARALGVELR